MLINFGFIGIQSPRAFQWIIPPLIPPTPRKKTFGDHLGIGIPIPIHHFVSGMFKQPIQTTSVQNQLLFFFRFSKPLSPVLPSLGASSWERGGEKLTLTTLTTLVFLFVFFGFRFQGHRNRWTHGTCNQFFLQPPEQQNRPAWKTNFCPNGNE